MLTFPGHGSPSVKATSLRIALLSENGGNEYPQKRRVLVKLSDRQGMIRLSMQVRSSDDDLARAIEKASGVVGSFI